MNKAKAIEIVRVISIAAIAIMTAQMTYAGSHQHNSPAPQNDTGTQSSVNTNVSSPVETAAPSQDRSRAKTATFGAVKTTTANLEKIYSENLPVISQSIDNAIKAIEAGDKEATLTELRKAQEMLALIKKITDLIKTQGMPASKFANVRCPITGSLIEPDKVTTSLIRTYKGEKIAFCCGNCPTVWEQLETAGKDAKLALSRNL
jgi:hypothetical protein